MSNVLASPAFSALALASAASKAVSDMTYLWLYRIAFRYRGKKFALIRILIRRFIASIFFKSLSTLKRLRA